MAIGPVIYNLLSNDAGVAALVGTRIFPNAIPQGKSLPAICYMSRGSNSGQSHGGSSGFSTDTIRIECWASLYSQAEALKEAVRLALQGFTGTVESVDVQMLLKAGETTRYEEPRDASETGTHGFMTDYRIGYAETQPA